MREREALLQTTKHECRHIDKIKMLNTKEDGNIFL